MTTWTPTSPLAKLVYVAGFLYDPSQDIIYSRMDALQRNLGYAYAYDAAALLMDTVIDCEPIFFTGQGKMWMVELWKGQYGLETGCEIGVYNRPAQNPPIYYPLLDAVVGTRPYDPAHGYFYQSADTADMLQMSFTLNRNGTPLFTRGPELHWWLTGFKWGVYSTPDQLTMDIAISLPAADMHAGFIAALSAMGYTYKDDGVTVSFTFAAPFAPQPWTGSPGLAPAQAMQQAIVATYDAFNLPNNDPNQVPAAVAAQIESAVMAKAPNFIGALLATALRNAGQTATAVATLIATELGAAAQAVTTWITTAGYDIVSWVESVYAAFAQIFTMNFSTAVEVVNLPYGGVAASDLTFVSLGINTHLGIDCGTFMVTPPAVIPAGTIGRFYLKDNLGPLGSEGWATYSYVNAQGNTATVTFTFGCPTGFSSNYVQCDQPGFAIYAKSGTTGGWGSQGSVPGSGHPLYAAYVWAQGPAPL
ncbi:DUF4474 domain-containing protein [Phenylobacterium sp.]|uniref:DUF4474 domain-containing protein n=1 Tax=Phenylobacterium sp. TaxID=1871053 RepID=UPI002FC81483